MKFSVIIIDSDFQSRSLLVDYLSRMANFDLVGQYDNYNSYFEHHELDKVDLFLIDIVPPTGAGIQFARAVAKYGAEVIFTFSCPEYILQGFELDILDYLLKPISNDRFARSMEKASKIISFKNGLPLASYNPPFRAPNSFKGDHQKFLFIKADYRILKVKYEEITFIEGFQEYVRIHLIKGKPIITLQSLKRIIEVLPASDFFRVHRSYIININHLEFVQQKMITIGGKELKVGKNYWDDFSGYLCSHGLF